MIIKLLRLILWSMALLAYATTLYYYEGFIFWQSVWWSWLSDTMLFYATHDDYDLPQHYYISAMMIIAITIVFNTIVTWLLSRARQSKSGETSKKGTHGSAAWAKRKDIKKAHLFQKQGIVLGAVKFLKFFKINLRYAGGEFVLVFAPTGAGKGISIVIPTLLYGWSGSFFVFDPKSENWQKTSGSLKKRGYKVLRFDPSDETQSICFNPLSELRYGTDKVIDDVQKLASILIPNSQQGGDNEYFRITGREWLVAAILHVTHKVKKEENRIASLYDVRAFFTGLSQNIDGSLSSAEQEEADGNEFNVLCDKMMSYKHNDEFVDQEVAIVASEMRKLNQRTRSSVHSTARSALVIFGSPTLRRVTSHSDFSIRELMHNDKPVAFFMTVNPDEIDRLEPLLRMMVELIVRRLTAKVENYKHKLLLLLDEFPMLGKVDVFKQSLAFMRGYGIQALVIVQGLDQLRDIYGNNETITSQFKVRVAFAPNDDVTAERLSKWLGKATVVQKKIGSSGKIGGITERSISHSVSEVGRPLLTADEVCKIPALDIDPKTKKLRKIGHAIIMVTGHKPIMALQRPYFKIRKALKATNIKAVNDGIIKNNGIIDIKNTNSQNMTNHSMIESSCDNKFIKYE